MATKPKLGQPRTPDEPQAHDLFETPNYAVDLLVPFIPKQIKKIWECAVGEGRLARRLQHHGYVLLGSDVRDCGGAYYNFITGDGADISWTENYAIVTNPPFSLKRLFFLRCLELSVPFALLMPADYSLWMIDAIRDYKCEKIIPFPLFPLGVM